MPWTESNIMDQRTEFSSSAAIDSDREKACHKTGSGLKTRADIRQGKWHPGTSHSSGDPCPGGIVNVCAQGPRVSRRA
jgi:hypothetical protein